MWGYGPSTPPEARRGASIGQVIREWRLERGWSQRDLERISGVNQSIISRLENGRVVGMQLSTLGRLAWALKAEEAVLLAWRPGAVTPSRRPSPPATARPSTSSSGSAGNDLGTPAPSRLERPCDHYSPATRAASA